MTAESAAALIQDLDCPLDLVKGSRLHRSTALTQLLDLAALLHRDMTTQKLKPVDFAALARAFCLVDERIRIRKGIPLPPSLHADVDAVSNAKRGKLRVLDLAPAEGPGDPAHDAAQVAKPKRGPFGRPLNGTPMPAAAPPPRRAAPQDLATDGATEQPAEQSLTPKPSKPEPGEDQPLTDSQSPPTGN